MRHLLAALTIFASLGCGVGEGDYVVFRVSTSAFEQTDACYFPEEEPPPNVAEDEDSFYSPATWVVFYAHGDRVVLDADGASLEGEQTSDGFSFVAHEVDVSYLGIDKNEAKLTVTSQTSIEMTVDGDAVSGEALQLISTRCDFITATPSPDLCEPTPDCERRAAFSGVKLDDVEITADVDVPNPI